MTMSLANSAFVNGISGSYTINGVGNLIAVMTSSGDTGTVASIADSGSKVTWVGTAAAKENVATGNTLNVEIWYGVTTATGATTITLTFSGTSTGADMEILELHSTVGTTWALAAPATPTAGGGQANSNTITWASETSAASGDQGYVGCCANYGTSGTGTGTGFTFATTANGNPYCYNLALAATTAYSPTCANSASQWGTAAAIFQATAGGGPVSATAAAQTGLSPDIPVAGGAVIGPGPNLTIVAFDL